MSVELISVVAALAALFGWLLKQVINYFISKNNEKDSYIKELVGTNQKNVDEFKQTVNHGQTKMNASIDNLARTMKDQTDIFKELIRKEK